MYVDDTHLWACSGSAYPPPMPPIPAQLPAPTLSPPPVVVIPHTVAPAANSANVATAVASAPVLATALAGATPGPNITRVAVAPPTQMFTGTAVAPRAEVIETASGWLSRIRLQEVLRWFLIASAIVGIFLVLLWLLRKLFGGPK
jgi:hypothetical protein